MSALTPDGLSVFSTYNGLCFRVSWLPIAGGTTYYLYRSEISYGDFARIATLASTVGLTYYDKPTTPNDNIDTKWFYRVSATDGTGESAQSGPCTYLNYSAFDSSPVPHLSWSSLF